MVSIASRQSWGARHRDGDINLPGLARKIIIHHTATAQVAHTASIEQERAQMRNLESIGQQRFRQGISYNVVIFPSGRAYQGVSWNRRGTHTGGHNSAARSIAFAGNYDTHQPTPAALATAANIIQQGRGRWWKATAPVKGHHNFRATACPGRNLRNLIPEIVRLANGRPPAPAAPPAPGAPSVLRRGSTGQRVRDLQAGFNRVFPSYQNSARVAAAGGGGRLLKEDGVYGPITAAWVSEFQSRIFAGQTVDGMVGARTGGALARHGIRNLGWN